MSYNKISLYIPPRRPINEVIGQLQSEIDIAQNIKSDEIKTSVINSLINIINHLNVCRFPKNGLIIFAGPNNEFHHLEPKKPIEINLYRCDDHFYREGLK